MVDEAAAKRVEAWMDAAIAGGAKVLVRGKRKGNQLPAALLEKVPHDSDLYRQEAFGPVALIEPFDDFEDAIDLVNESDFGLQAACSPARSRMRCARGTGSKPAA